jgi:hypothetical protein
MRRVFLFIGLFVSFSCVDPIDLKLASEEERLVVDGIVTSAPGPYTIKLSTSLPFDNTQVLPGYFKAETKASVSISDNAGNVISLIEKKAGVYETPVGFNAKVGNTYWLSIRLDDGRQYESSPETLEEVPALDSIHHEYITYKRLIRNSQGSYVEVGATGFRLAGAWQDPPLERNYYRWELSGIFEFFSITDVPTIKQCWAPLDRLESTVLLSDDEFYDGKQTVNDLAIILYDRPTQFLATVTQYRLSENAYNFWKSYQAQQFNTGSIFDPAPAPIAGNIRCITNPDETVLGFFGASGIFVKKLLINRFKSSGMVSPTPYKEPIPGDCTKQEPNATNVKPPGFN